MYFYFGLIRRKERAEYQGSGNHGDHDPPLPLEYCLFAVSLYSESALRGCANHQVGSRRFCSCILYPALALDGAVAGAGPQVQLVDHDVNIYQYLCSGNKVLIVVLHFKHCVKLDVQTIVVYCIQLVK